jgi:hypothetical protein
MAFAVRPQARLTAPESVGRRCVQLRGSRADLVVGPRLVHGALAFWMQTTGAVLLAVKRRSPACVWMPAQDSRSAYRLLYLAAVRADRREQEHRQGVLDIDPSLVSQELGALCVVGLPAAGWTMLSAPPHSDLDQAHTERAYEPCHGCCYRNDPRDLEHMPRDCERYCGVHTFSFV